MSLLRNTMQFAIPAVLFAIVWTASPTQVWAQGDLDRDAVRDHEEYQRYRDSLRRDPIPPARPPRRSELIPRQDIVPRIRYDDSGLDDYWHDRLQQYRFQTWYGDNYNRYWPENYRGYFRKQSPPYSFWNPRDDGYDSGYRAWRTVRNAQFR